MILPAAAAGRFEARVARAGGTHSSLAAALAAAPPGDTPYRILLGLGRWEEKLIVSRANVQIIGEDRRATRLGAATAAGHLRPDGRAWGTYGSATLTVEAPGFTARNLTIANDFDYPGNMRTQAVANAQAVALVLGDGADRSVIEQVDLIGHQDSFYLKAGRALVRNCLVAGSVDFIFGGAAAWLEGCELRARVRPGESPGGYIAAPSTPRAQRFGLTFSRCRLTREPGVPDGSVYLGRPWRAGGNTALLGAAAYLDCWMDRHVASQGWAAMTYRRNGQAIPLEPGDARLFEHGSIGPGAHRSPARRQLSVAEARLYGRDALLGDWQTG